MSFNPCLIVPVYNHVDGVASIVEQAESINLPCIFVNDGSDAATTQALEEAAKHPLVALLSHEKNSGKGAACITGMRHAFAQGYTHAVQVDADGQHDLSDIPKFLQAAESNPEHLIIGKPIFDASIPKVRYYGRYLTHALVWLECLSTELKDTMCGFRVYPLARTLPVLDRSHIGARMDYDMEVAVRMYWAGVKPFNVETKVIYPEDSVSHFRMIRDNVRISLMHTRLILGMILRIPSLLRLRNA